MGEIRQRLSKCLDLLKKEWWLYFSQNAEYCRLSCLIKRRLLLPQVLEALKNERPNSRLDTWFLHQDNAPAHPAGKTIDYLREVGVKLLGHPPYSPDLAPCDFALFPYAKKALKGRKFSNDEELIGAFEEICGSVSDGFWGDVFST
ncbi:unnamed protein product [Arctia plantaginis]|uniref:Transposase n=1 Tax=Arctia plantaginis TaxID=874455 RepID=A0A8S0ZXN5_ARCPL|nr:unnamed protein product [Arctia plantaginis]CAB3238438.1 unnamed protein product [Arctia plantaginis]